MLLSFVIPETLLAVALLFLVTQVTQPLQLGTRGAGRRPRDVPAVLSGGHRPSALLTIGKQYEEAAIDLGASPGRRDPARPPADADAGHLREHGARLRRRGRRLRHRALPVLGRVDRAGVGEDLQHGARRSRRLRSTRWRPWSCSPRSSPSCIGLVFFKWISRGERRTVLDRELRARAVTAVAELPFFPNVIDGKERPAADGARIVVCRPGRSGEPWAEAASIGPARRRRGQRCGRRGVHRRGDVRLPPSEPTRCSPRRRCWPATRTSSSSSRSATPASRAEAWPTRRSLPAPTCSGSMPARRGCSRAARWGSTSRASPRASAANPSASAARWLRGTTR